MSGKRSGLAIAIDSINAKIAALEAARAELLAVQTDKPKRPPKPKPDAPASVAGEAGTS